MAGEARHLTERTRDIIGQMVHSIFVAIVCSAVAFALLVAPWLSWSIRRRERVDLARILARKAILPALDAGDRFGAIRELCQAAAPLTDLSVDEVIAAVEAREHLQGTGIGHGIAVPHARIESLRRPLIAFGRAAAGVAWDAPDGEPVKFVFLVLTPARQEGLQLQ